MLLTGAELFTDVLKELSVTGFETPLNELSEEVAPAGLSDSSEGHGSEGFG